MKLTRLRVQDLLGIQSADVDLSRPITCVFGQNGAGKSSLVDAIRVAFTGRARCTDAAGRGAKNLVRVGAQDALVSLSVEEGGKARVLSWRVSTDGVSRADQRDIADADVIDALLDMPSLLDQKPARQSEILTGILDPSIPLEEMLAMAREGGLSAEAGEALAAGLLKRLPAGGPVTPGVLADAYETVYKRRTTAKSELDGALKTEPLRPLPQAPIPTAEEITAARDAATQADTAKAKANQAVGTLRAQVALLERKDEDLVRIVRELAMLPKAAAPAQGSLVLGPTIEDLVNAVAAATRNEVEIKAALDAAVYVAREAAATEKRCADELRSLEAGSTSCTGTLGASVVCPVMRDSAAERAKEIPLLRKALSGLQTKLGAAQAAEGKARTAWEQACQAAAAARKAETEARQASAKSEGAHETHRHHLEQRIAELEADLKPLAAKRAELAQTEESLFAIARTAAEAAQAVERLSGIGAQAEAHRAWEAKRDELRGDVALLEELCKAIEPKGLPSKLLALKCGPFELRVNATLYTLTGGELAVRIRAEKGLVLDVLQRGASEPLSPDLLSASERFRLGVSLAVAVSIATGLRWVVIDEADILVGESKDALGDELLGLVESDELESVVILASRETPTAERPLPTPSGMLGVYWVEGGCVNSVEAGVPA